MIRKLLLPALLTGLLAGCVTGYNYRQENGGDYYYGEPGVDYRYYDYGYGGYGYGYGYGNYGWPYYGYPYYSWYGPGWGYGFHDPWPYYYYSGHQPRPEPRSLNEPGGGKPSWQDIQNRRAQSGGPPPEGMLMRRVIEKPRIQPGAGGLPRSDEDGSPRVMEKPRVQPRQSEPRVESPRPQPRMMPSLPPMPRTQPARRMGRGSEQ